MQDETCEHVMEAKHHRWALVQCEPHIWALLVSVQNFMPIPSASVTKSPQTTVDMEHLQLAKHLFHLSD
jgi:hypothetical protein